MVAMVKAGVELLEHVAKAYGTLGAHPPKAKELAAGQ